MDDLEHDYQLVYSQNETLKSALDIQQQTIDEL